METALYPVDKAIFGATDPSDSKALMNFFKEHNIAFPQGAKVAYVSLLSRLVVTNTAENLSAIASLLQELHEDREPLVEVTAKFMEVQQSNLKELGFQYSLIPRRRTAISDTVCSFPKTPAWSLLSRS